MHYIHKYVIRNICKYIHLKICTNMHNYAKNMQNMHVPHHYGPDENICKNIQKICKKYAKYAGIKLIFKICKNMHPHFADDSHENLEFAVIGPGHAGCTVGVPQRRSKSRHGMSRVSRLSESLQLVRVITLISGFGAFGVNL